ncbi:50S ribosomal protein L3 [Desulfococcaceae bacterium HSG8]|nr:50S ribosomal protein L3 [Desulfococcaceae bacterium HSG8]
MCNGLIGKKLGMAGVFSSEGKYIPVTLVKAGPCVVTQIKTDMTDGYNALQLGFGEKKSSRTNKPLKGHFRKSGDELFAFLREFSVDDPEEYALGQTITPDELFQIGERVHVSGMIRGRGFSGVIKRHGFHGGRKTHGSKSHRIPGSVGCSAWPSKVIKGKKLPGQYGNTKKTIKNIEIIDIRPEDSLIMVKGALPGARSGLVTLHKKTL